MTTISITFVICLSDYERKSSRKKSRGKNISKVSIIEEESTIALDLKEVEETPFETSSKYIINAERPSKSLQIDYEIIPKFIYSVDILFWGPIAKIITKDKIRSVSTIKKLKNCWITFTIEHIFMLDINELISCRSHTISFNMRLEKGGNISNVPVPESSTFFFLNEDIDLNCIFAEVFEYVPNNDDEETSRAEEDVKLILRDIMYFAFRGEILSVLKLPDINNRKKIINIINSFVAKKEYDCFNTHLGEGVNANEILNAKPPSPITKKKAEKKPIKKKPDKKRRKSSTQENNTFELNVSGQILFTDPNMTVFNVPKRSKDMKCTFIIVNVKNLIDPIQKSILNPVIVKLNKLINVPVEHLNKQRFDYLYLTYNLCGFSCTTLAKQITNTIYYKNHKIFFLEEKIKTFSQQVQKDYFVVQIRGLRNCLVKNEAELFGTNPRDEFLSAPLRNKKEIAKYLQSSSVSYNESVLVAVACLKLNPLLSTFRTFTETEQCLHPTRCPMPLALTTTKNDAEMNTFTVNMINSHTGQTNDDYPLSEDILLDSEWCAVVQMELLRSINKLLDCMIQEEGFYNRLILVTGHGDLAKYILSNVFTHNSCWIYKDDIVPPNYLPNNESSTDINNVNIISGFSIDNGDIFIMFLEGNAKWVKNVLWQHIRNESFTCAKILYNSDYVYKDRIYTSLIPYGGVYNITLHSSLKTILNSSKIFSPGCLPEPTRRAFEKIDMILKSKSLNEITIHMLPTKKELLSLDVEWGVPVHWPLAEE